MMTHAQALQLYTLSLVAQLHLSVSMEILREFWTKGVPSPSQLQRSHPDLNQSKIEKVVELLRGFEELERRWSNQTENLESDIDQELRIELPLQVTITCINCHHEVLVARNAFATVESQLAYQGCSVCGHKHHHGGWFKV